MIKEVREAYRDFLQNMHGICPNRLLLNPEDAARLKLELTAEVPYQIDHGAAIHVHGMRLVVDRNAVGVEVGYVR